MDQKIAIVVQGPSLYVKEVKNAWKDYKQDIIFSTWVGSENEYDSDDIVIFNKFPKYAGHWNLNYQKISSYNGLLKAKELGYSWAIKIRSDYLPTNAKEFLKILKPDKINVLLWHYTEFLLNRFPTFKGYITDHLVAGPIDELIEMWNFKQNLCSAQTVITWSYIKKLSKKIGIYYFLNDLNNENDLFYIKQNSQTPFIFGFNSPNNKFGGKTLMGRYESVHQCCEEYKKTPEETQKYMNDKYLNFLRYYNPLPKITILNESNIEINTKDIIYPEFKLELVTDKNKITNEYVIRSEKLVSPETLISEYFKKINVFYDDINQYYFYNDNKMRWDNPGNFTEDGYKEGFESIGESDLLTIDEFNWNPPKNEFGSIDLDFLEIGTDLIKECDDESVGITIDENKENLDISPNRKNILKLNKIVTTDEVINTKIKIKNKYIDLVNIINLLKLYKIRKIKCIKDNKKCFDTDELIKNGFLIEKIIN